MTVGSLTILFSDRIHPRWESLRQGFLSTIDPLLYTERLAIKN